MSREEPPSHPLFDAAPGRSRGTTTDPDDWFGLADDRDRERLRQVEEHLERAQERQRDKRPFRPMLLVRARAGDRGDRPITYPFWESPDIWIRHGEPAANPDAPTSQTSSVVAGEPYTLYAHVWNLGLAPLMGVTVEFLVFDPSLTFANQVPLFRAVVRVDLSGRSSPTQCHRLVKCSRAWVPSVVNDGHECLLVRVSGVGDPLGPAHEWDAWADRHLGQRNIGVLPAGASLAPVLRQLDANRFEGLRIQLSQVGADDIDVLALHLPEWRVDPRVKTQLLAEIGADTSLTVLDDLAQPFEGRRRPGGRVGAGGPRGEAVRRVAVDRLLDLAQPQDAGAAFLQSRRAMLGASDPSPGARGGSPRLLNAGARMADLFRHTERLPAGRRDEAPLDEPAKGDAQVLRVAAYDREQLVGGYTVVVTSR